MLLGVVDQILNCLVRLCLSIFLANFEITIVSTSLVSITNDLKSFGSSSWAVTAYLITYTSFMIIWAKLSDIFGRKPMISLAIFIFLVFSGGCGAVQTMAQLIVCRAFQGLGGSGAYSLTLVILFEMVPPARYPIYTVLVTIIFAFSLLMGPIFGGLINVHTKWIWVFLLNVPSGAIALILLLITMPSNFPCESGSPRRMSYSMHHIDFLGAALLLAAVALCVAGLEEASTLAAWTSRTVLAPLVISAPLVIAFFTYEWLVTKREGRDQAEGRDNTQPIFPWRFCRSRVIMGIIINSFLVGVPFTTLVVQIPLRFQVVNNFTPLQAGLRLIPFSFACPTGASLVAILASKRRLPPLYLMFASATFQTIGLVLLSTLHPGNPDWKGQYGIQVITGLGVGLAMGVTTLMMPFAIEARDLAIGTAAVAQFRLLGGAIGIAIVTAVMNSWLRGEFRGILTLGEVQGIFKTTHVIENLPVELQKEVRKLIVRGFNLQIRILLGFAGAQFLVAAGMWTREPILLA
ncbi:putative multidrug resistance protein fnx1 [Lindgomyces ingoldianus]|uniref:Multidrug resistance protein fnx1 n=1 Tax=Lindgomyces ingoldianus TaxID=673940 RepID=A0ACB6QCT6_9PLEO|nr:putative multidrug resistance protein fnx1 [Lindgomyces ingoldianus]KAF2464423.1 putative multidrug resistance protein fnx1 [Lindgomyces ingoldianus]